MVNKRLAMAITRKETHKNEQNKDRAGGSGQSNGEHIR